jgi:hypothetical protein
MFRCAAPSIAVAAAHRNPEKYVTEDFAPHDWVVDAVATALQSNLNGS